MHLLITGLLLGWGAAIPIGPIGIEMIRRNLQSGLPAGLGFGFGASSGDLTYLVLLTVGSLTFLNHPRVLHSLSGIGAMILLWFGIQSFKAVQSAQRNQEQKASKPSWKHFVEGYLLISLNPYTVLFWVSVSGQAALLGHHELYNAVLLGLGVMFGVFSWALVLNMIIHSTKHKLSDTVMRTLSILGGLIITGFGIIFLVHALHYFLMT